ncbi:hypothetical protein BMF94_4709 [Rhodotorula taiwanensis]|uniref:Transmembrane protein 188 n=1 Tax=Rhodotorula taiwanensis TaxID=741276 RepID=A0A2S5B686_9BASI|nr:hypothetical protein BMF94_4709 [Rhodotorula taiwanensis]
MQPASTGGGRMRSGTSSLAAAGRSGFHPPANRESFKDLLVFEERLKQNAERLQKQRRKYEAFLLTLSGVIAYLGYSVFVLPSIYSLVHYSNVAMLLVAATTLVLFFATGMYSEKIAYAHKFVPQANRALRPFNIYLNTRRRSRFVFVSRWFNSNPAAAAGAGAPLSRTSSIRSNASSTSTASSGGGGGGAPLSRQTSNASSASSASENGFRSPPASPPLSPMASPPESPSATASSRTIDLPSLPPIPTTTSSNPTPPTTASTSSSREAVTRALPVVNSTSSRQPVPLPPIPPSLNPRGELIFSSRVSPAFREGYERYRGEWERRRAEAKRAAKNAKKQQQGKGKQIGAAKASASGSGAGGTSWLGWGRGSKTEAVGTEAVGRMREKEIDLASQRHDDQSQSASTGDDDRPRDRMRFQSPTPPPPTSSPHAPDQLRPTPLSSSPPGRTSGRTAFRHVPLPRSDSEQSGASADESKRSRLGTARRRTPSSTDSGGPRLGGDAPKTSRELSRDSSDTELRAYDPDRRRHAAPNDLGIESASLGLTSSPTLSSSSLFSSGDDLDVDLHHETLRTRGGRSTSEHDAASPFPAEEGGPAAERSTIPTTATLSGAATRVRAESFSDLLTYEGEIDDEDQRGVLGSAARLPRLERSNSMRRGG